MGAGTLTANDAIQFTCPFCGGTVSAGRFSPGPSRLKVPVEVKRTDTLRVQLRRPGEPAVLHTLPMCERYDALEPLAFLTECRKFLSGPRS